MGMYTELNIGVDLAPSTPDNVIKILDYMLGDEEVNVETPDHPLFQEEFELPYLIWRDEDRMRLLDVYTKDGW